MRTSSHLRPIILTFGVPDAVIIAPMTTAERSYPTRVPITFQQRHGQVAVDQIRSVDRQRLVRRLGTAPARAVQAVSAALVEIFTR